MKTAPPVWSLLFSLIGVGFFMYGKQQKALVPLLCGKISRMSTLVGSAGYHVR